MAFCRPLTPPFGRHHSAYPCTEVAVLGVAHPLWAGAKGRLTPQPLHFHFAPGYRLSRQPCKISGSGSSAPCSHTSASTKGDTSTTAWEALLGGILKGRSSLPVFFGVSVQPGETRFSLLCQLVEVQVAPLFPVSTPPFLPSFSFLLRCISTRTSHLSVSPYVDGVGGSGWW